MEIQDIFISFFQENNFEIGERSSLVSDFFKNEFNLSGAHKYLIPTVKNSNPIPQRDIAVLDWCIRKTDGQIIGISDIHLLLFEMGVWGTFGFIENKKEEEYRQISLLLSFLNRCGIDKNELYCTICAGGNYLNEKITLDTDSNDILLSLGIKSDRIFQTTGRRNFMLSKGIDRLAGYNIEIFVKRNNQFVEIASSNIYQYVNKLTYLKKTLNSGIGCGVGIERLQFIINEKNNIYGLQYFQWMKDDIKRLLHISEESINIISDKIYRISEISKTLIFLLSDGQDFDKTPQGKTMKTYLAKIISELYFLSIPAEEYVSILKYNIDALYNKKYKIKDNCYNILYDKIKSKLQ